MKLLSILVLAATATTTFANDRGYDYGDRGSRYSNVREEVIDRNTLKLSTDLDVNIRRGESIGVKRELQLRDGEFVKVIVVRALSQRGNGQLDLMIGGRIIDTVHVPYNLERIRIPVHQYMERGMPVKLVARGNITIQTLIAKVEIRRVVRPDRPRRPGPVIVRPNRPRRPGPVVVRPDRPRRPTPTRPNGPRRCRPGTATPCR